jgi:hypothetical protein
VVTCKPLAVFSCIVDTVYVGSGFVLHGDGFRPRVFTSIDFGGCTGFDTFRLGVRCKGTKPLRYGTQISSVVRFRSVGDTDGKLVLKRGGNHILHLPKYLTRYKGY